jgi:predicted nucleotidyltransferase
MADPRDSGPATWSHGHDGANRRSARRGARTRHSRNLGEDLIGLYLYGSFVAGGFEPDASDIDMLAVLTREAAQAFIAQVAAEV